MLNAGCDKKRASTMGKEAGKRMKLKTVPSLPSQSVAKGSKADAERTAVGATAKSCPTPVLVLLCRIDSSNGRGKRRAGQDGQTALKILETLELSGLSDENLDLIQRLIQRPGFPGERP